MPCQSDCPDPRPGQINRLTQDLCYLCGTLLVKDLFDECASDRIKTWWDEHLAADTARVRGEMEKAFGVSMSTVYKRAAAVRRVIPWAWPTRGDAG